ncbi:MAG: hypothetical protein NT062_26580 [Proteobacteria bacterium]|nr:hypothetical protein [Pseudomonadota bacterium]
MMGAGTSTSTSRLVAVAMASLLITSPVLAQPKPTAQQKQQAGELVKQAIAKSQANDHEAAIELYLGAYAIVPLPLLLSNIGSEYKTLARPVEALKYFCKYLDAEPTGSNASYASSEAKVLQIQLGNTTVDDKAVCAPPPPIVEKKAPEPVVVVPPPIIVPPPAHAAPGRALEYAGLGIAGLGAIGLAFGIGFGLQASSISDTISNHDPSQPWPADIAQQERDGQAAEDKQVILMTVGGIVLVGGAVLFLLGRSKAHHELTVTPSAGAGTVGVVFAGGF